MGGVGASRAEYSLVIFGPLESEVLIAPATGKGNTDFGQIVPSR